MSLVWTTKYFCFYYYFSCCFSFWMNKWMNEWSLFLNKVSIKELNLKFFTKKKARDALITKEIVRAQYFKIKQLTIFTTINNMETQHECIYGHCHSLQKFWVLFSILFQLYSLYAIVVHSGVSSDSGHYYTYAREPKAFDDATAQVKINFLQNKFLKKRFLNSFFFNCFLQIFQ